MNTSFDLNKLTLDRKPHQLTQATKPPRHAPGVKFLKGPVSWDWLCCASQLPGKALHVGTALWHLAGLKRSRTVPLSGSITRELGIDRHASYRGLKQLEKAELVSVVRHAGRNPIVTLLELPAAE